MAAYPKRIMKNKILQGDCLEVMKELNNNSVDLIITSPPYEDIHGAGYAAQKKDILFLKLYSCLLYTSPSPRD